MSVRLSWSRIEIRRTTIPRVIDGILLKASAESLDCILENLIVTVTVIPSISCISQSKDDESNDHFKTYIWLVLTECSSLDQNWTLKSKSVTINLTCYENVVSYCPIKTFPPKSGSRLNIKIKKRRKLIDFSLSYKIIFVESGPK